MKIVIEDLDLWLACSKKRHKMFNMAMKDFEQGKIPLNKIGERTIYYIDVFFQNKLSIRKAKLELHQLGIVDDNYNFKKDKVKVVLRNKLEFDKVKDFNCKVDYEYKEDKFEGSIDDFKESIYYRSTICMCVAIKNIQNEVSLIKDWIQTNKK